MEVQKFDNIEIYQWNAEMNKIASSAAHSAIEENKRLGVPSSFESDGVAYFQMPDGSITTKNPF
jgi:hypothetical protein